MPIGYTFALSITFHLLQCWCNTCTNAIINDMIHFISSCNVLVQRSLLHLLFTIAFVHRCQVIAQASRHVVQRLASDLPFTHATSPSCQVLSYLLHLVIWLHVMSHMQWVPSSHNYIWTNHLCISLKHILVHLSCHSITKTEQGHSISPFLVIVDDCTKIWKLGLFWIL
jgi:hypothetical protein